MTMSLRMLACLSLLSILFLTCSVHAKTLEEFKAEMASRMKICDPKNKKMDEFDTMGPCKHLESGAWWRCHNPLVQQKKLVQPHIDTYNAWRIECARKHGYSLIREREKPSVTPNSPGAVASDAPDSRPATTRPTPTPTPPSDRPKGAPAGYTCRSIEGSNIACKAIVPPYPGKSEFTEHHWDCRTVNNKRMVFVLENGYGLPVPQSVRDRCFR